MSSAAYYTVVGSVSGSRWSTGSLSASVLVTTGYEPVSASYCLLFSLRTLMTAENDRRVLSPYLRFVLLVFCIFNIALPISPIFD